MKYQIQSKVLLLCLVAGWFIELAGNYIIYPIFDSYIIVHSVQSIIYTSLFFTCAWFYKKAKNKLVLLLGLMAFIYGFLLLITINDSVYNYLRGIIWYDSVNFLFLYRCVEMFILIKVINDGVFTDWIRNAFVGGGSSDSVYINSNNSEVF